MSQVVTSEPSSQICRTCLVNPGSICLFECSSQDSNIPSEMLLTCTAVTVMSGDHGPQQMCVACMRRLRDAFSFRSLCQRSEATLRGMEHLKHEIKPEGFSNALDISFPIATSDCHRTEVDSVCQDYDDDDSTSFLPLSRLKTEELEVIHQKEEIDDDVKLSSLKREVHKVPVKHKKTSKERKHKKKLKEKTIEELYFKDVEIVIKKPQTKRRKDTKEDRYYCDICVYSAKNQYQLINHIRCHTGEKPFQCDSCDKKYPSKISLRCHVEKCHNAPVCDLCGKVYRHLKQHRLTHTQNKDHQCNMCVATFYTLSQLNQHLKMHNKAARVRRYPCHLCNKLFYTSNDCKKHQDFHNTNKKMHTCHMCLKQYSSKAILATHMKKHTGIKKFKCDHCGKAFPSKAEIRSHMITHLGKKTFECDECGKSFVRKNSLATHKISHAKTKNFVCEICNQRFAHGGSLCEHKKKKHNIISNRSIEPVSLINPYK